MPVPGAVSGACAVADRPQQAGVGSRRGPHLARFVFHRKKSADAPYRCAGEVSPTAEQGGRRIFRRLDRRTARIIRI